MAWVMLSAMDKSVDFVKQFTLIFAVYAEYVLTEFNLTYIVSALSFPFQNEVDLRTIATWRLINLNNPKKSAKLSKKSSIWLIFQCLLSWKDIIDLRNAKTSNLLSANDIVFYAKIRHFFSIYSIFW